MHTELNFCEVCDLVVASLQRWDIPAHPKFALNVKTDDALYIYIHTPRGYEKDYNSNNDLCIKNSVRKKL